MQFAFMFSCYSLKTSRSIFISQFGRAEPLFVFHIKYQVKEAFCVWKNTFKTYLTLN